MTEGSDTLPPGWAWTTVEELTPRTRPTAYGVLQPGDDVKHGIPLVRVSDIDDGRIDASQLKRIDPKIAAAYPRTTLQGGEVVMTIVGTIGRTAVVPETLAGANTARAVAVIPLVSLVHAPWIELWFRGAEQVRTMSSMAHEVARKTLNLEDVRRATIRIPPMAEQQRIVGAIEERFSRLDAAVAGLMRVQQQLKRYRASVLKAACEGRLVPTEAELSRAEGRTYEPADLLLARILEERRTQGGVRYKEPVKPKIHELGDLPDGWSWATWEQLASRVTVGHVGAMQHEYVSTGVPFLRSQNVRENRFDRRGLLYISPAFHRALSKSMLLPNDLVVVRSGSVGVTCVIPDTLGEANCADLVIVKQPVGIHPLYGSFYMNSLAKSVVRAGQVGIALTHFNTKSVAALAIALPPLAERHRIVAEVERRLSVIEKAEAVVAANLKRAAQMRQSILKQAFEGKLVPQDPNDEPASLLLERIRAEREAADATTPKRRGRPPAREAAGTKAVRNGQLSLLDADLHETAKPHVNGSKA